CCMVLTATPCAAAGFTRVTARRIAQPPRGDLCHEAPAHAVTRTSRSSATGSIDNSCSQPRTEPTVRIAFLHALLESDLAGIGVAPAPIAGPSARQRGTGPWLSLR